MNDRARLIAALALAALLLPSAVIAQRAQSAPKAADSISEADVAYPYRLLATTNIWTYILPDTAIGRAWQVQFSVDDTQPGRWLINGSSLLPDGAPQKNGRFALYPTQNMYNFLLLDREDS